LRNQNFEPIECVSVAGDDLHFWYSERGSAEVPDFVASHAQAFDEGTIQRLRRLSVAVIGASGTGSPTIEQLARLGVGEILIVDPDHVEVRNINRIFHATMNDAKNARLKAEVLADAIKGTGLDTHVTVISKNLWDPEVVREVSQCDVVFGCMDSIDGRFLLNAISTSYNIPYFDIGIRLVADRDSDNRGRVREVCGTVHYIRPGRSSLMSRGLFNMTDVAAAGLSRRDPAAHQRQIKDGYIRGAPAHRPAVISVNMFASSLAVNEFLARLHPYREEPNANHGSVTFSLASMELIPDPEQGLCDILMRSVGAGDRLPLLELMELAERKSP
jgi:hypothetical protein